jgi:hypothetical protein
MQAWVAQETAAADLGDVRLNQRLGILLGLPWLKTGHGTLAALQRPVLRYWAISRVNC